MQTIATFAKPEDAHMLRARLEGSGVPAFIRDEHTIALYWFYSQAIGGVKVEVDDDDAERAREILALPPSEPGVITCPLCGSENVRVRELNIWAGLLMILGTILPIHSRRVDCLACRRSFKATDGIMKMSGASSAPPPPGAP